MAITGDLGQFGLGYIVFSGISIRIFRVNMTHNNETSNCFLTLYSIHISSFPHNVYNLEILNNSDVFNIYFEKLQKTSCLIHLSWHPIKWCRTRSDAAERGRSGSTLFALDIEISTENGNNEN